MTAQDVLRLARENGIHLRVDSGNLLLEADREPSPHVVEAVRRYKSEIIAALSSREQGVTSDLDVSGAAPELSATQLRQWFVVTSDVLDGERILVVSNLNREKEARAAHPDLVVYMAWEVKALLSRNVAPSFAKRIHHLKRMFDAVILPDEGIAS